MKMMLLSVPSSKAHVLWHFCFTGSNKFVLTLIFSFHCVSGYFLRSGVRGNVADAMDKTKATTGGSFPPDSN